MSVNSLSAPGGVNDGSLNDLATTSAPQQPRASGSGTSPSSPKPRLMFDPLPPPSTEPSNGERGASAIMTLDDYKRLNQRTQTDGLLGGIAGGGLVTYLVRRYAPKQPTKNGLFLTFLLSSTFVSYLTSHTLLVRELSAIRARVAYQRLPQAPDGGGVILPDTVAIGDQPVPSAVESKKTPEQDVAEELKNLGKKKDRTRWAKGQGLVGEVEEEGELRDTWLRPGIPRREV